MDDRTAWGLIGFAIVATGYAVYRAARSRAAGDAMRVAGMGCATFVLGAVFVGLLVIEGLRRVAAFDDEGVKNEVFSRWLERTMLPGNTGIVAGVVFVIVGAWLRARAVERTR